MSGLEVLAVLPVVAALISAFADGEKLGEKAKKLWKKHKNKHKNATAIDAAEQNLDLSLVNNPQQIQSGFHNNVRKFGRRFRIGDDRARMELMWSLVDMQTNMIRTCQLMLSEGMEYDPSRLLRTSNQVRDSSLNSFHGLAQRLEVQAPIQRLLPRHARDSWDATSATGPDFAPQQQLSRAYTLPDSDDDPADRAEQQRITTLAQQYADAIPHPGSTQSQSPAAPPPASPDLSSGLKAFCTGPVHERCYSGSLSIWQCHACGSSISFDYNEVDRSEPFARLIFSCHLPVMSETVRYKCIICRLTGDHAGAGRLFEEKMVLIAHFGREHTAEDFERAEFDGEIWRSSCFVP